MISFLIPTRKRLDHLRKSIESLEYTCNNLNSFEVLIAFDEDDTATIEGFRRLNLKANIRHYVLPRYGYKGLQHYYNHLAAQALGNWLWLWNDDCTMVAQGWDKVVNGRENSFQVIYPKNLDENYHVMFPVLPKKWFDLLGVFSRWNHNDTYIWYMIRPLISVFCFEPKITHRHPWPRIQDEVTSEINYNSNCPWALLRKDRHILREHLNIGPIYYGFGLLVSFFRRSYEKIICEVTSLDVHLFQNKQTKEPTRK